MKYLWSGILSSTEKTCVSPDCVKYIGWIGGLCYAVIMITCWCILMVTFPEFSDIAKLLVWYDFLFDPIVSLSSKIWAVFNMVSTMVTIVGIYKIIRTLREIKKYESNIKTN
jgi:hypothetical protein